MADGHFISRFLFKVILYSALNLLTGVIFPAYPEPGILSIHFHVHTKGSDPPYSSLTSVQSPMKAECAHRCSVARACKAFIYTNTRMCHLQGVRVIVSSGVHDEGKIYYIQHEGTNLSTLPLNHTNNSSVHERVLERSNLKTGANCAVNRPSCISSSCCCEVGWNYDPKAKQCVKGCKSYGSTMTVYKGYSLVGNNDEVFRGITLKQCIQKCVSLKKFICKAFDYGKEANIPFLPNGCMLSKNGFFDVSFGARKKTNHFKIGVRDCKP